MKDTVKVFKTKDDIRRINTAYQQKHRNKVKEMKVVDESAKVKKTEDDIRREYNNRRKKYRKIVSNFTGYTCKCQATYYGANCENQINVCQNKTCSGKGYCFNLQNVPTCKCFSSYSGGDCELASSYVKTVKGVQTTASIIAFIVLAAILFLILVNDGLNILILKPKTTKNQQKLNQSAKQKFHYIAK